MSKTVYLLGAGVNVELVSDWYGGRPPLSNDLFKQLSGNPWFDKESLEKEASELFQYIKEYWGITLDELFHELFDLELFLSLVDGQLDDKFDPRVHTVREQMLSLFYSYLDHIRLHARDKSTLIKLCQRITADNAVTLSLNYDLLLEDAFGSAFGPNTPFPKLTPLLPKLRAGKITDEIMNFSAQKWRTPLAYGVRFDWVHAGVPGTLRLVDGARFYSHGDNELYQFPILKLHGSLNWRHLIGRSAFPNGTAGHLPSPLNGYLLSRTSESWPQNMWLPPTESGTITERVVIPPTPNKRHNHRILTEVWQRALCELRDCEHLIVVGYSLPAADFNVRRLLLEGFAGRGVRKLTIVNPDPNAVAVVRSLLRFRGSVEVYQGVGDFAK